MLGMSSLAAWKWKNKYKNYFSQVILWRLVHAQFVSGLKKSKYIYIHTNSVKNTELFAER